MNPIHPIFKLFPDEVALEMMKLHFESPKYHITFDEYVQRIKYPSYKIMRNLYWFTGENILIMETNILDDGTVQEGHILNLEHPIVKYVGKLDFHLHYPNRCTCKKSAHKGMKINCGYYENGNCHLVEEKEVKNG